MATPAFLTGSNFIRTLGLTFAGIAALVTIDTFLAKVERAEDHEQASRLFREGQQLMREGKAQDSVERFRSAVTFERRNRDYQIGLAEAQLAAGKLSDSQVTLADLLQTDSTDGATNLIMARVLRELGQFSDAASFYHRAIYGRWKNDPLENRVQARFELIDLLTRQNAREEILAELLPLQAEAPDDLQTRMRIGQLFTTAGSASRGADVFREVLRSHPQEAAAYAGLGEAEFARGNFRTARANFITALRLSPDNSTFRQRLEASNQILRLDPTQRGLAPGERYARSQKLLELTLQAVISCVGRSAPAATMEVLEMARKTLTLRIPLSRQSEAAEASLDFAERLWDIQKEQCPQGVSTSNQSLALVLTKLAQ